jgi:predicted hotdog family 3-hydroxylacyl-ACP dehydratase
MNWQDLSLGEILPHAGRMILLERILSADAEQLTAEVIVRHDRIYSNQVGAVPVSVSVEYMAQAVAAFAGVRALQRGDNVSLGLLLGVRGFSSPISHFIARDVLEVRVKPTLETPNGLGVFDCGISRSEDRIHAQLTVIAVDALPDNG